MGIHAIVWTLALLGAGVKTGVMIGVILIWWEVEQKIKTEVTWLIVRGEGVDGVCVSGEQFVDKERWEDEGM